MFRNRVYYSLKPIIPQSLRMGLRRWFAQRMRERVQAAWPIAAGSEQVPAGWKGWPNGKRFAVVLTHDVEGEVGVRNCQALMGLEMKAGFRSSFNFIPEGPYRTPKELRDELVREGFEVGIHDLKHDGRLFNSRVRFGRSACKINRYLAEWGAVGFRSGFMLHELDWLHDLEIEYDLSTFDTDPFEPQPQGRGTIFPFLVPSNEKTAPESDPHAASAFGYVEMPYTLPQDSTLFLLLREKTPEIWFRKLDWIVEHGGMVLVNIHPDYISSSGQWSSDKYPVSIVEELLTYISTKYAGQYWNPLPRELARWYRSARTERSEVTVLSSGTSSHPGRALPVKRVLREKRAAVLLYSFYPSDPRPRRAAEALVESGMNVDLFCLRERDEPLQESINGVKVWRLPIQKKRGSKWDYFIQYSRFLLHSFWFLARRGIGGRYDLVHVHNMPDVLVFAAMAPKWRNAAIILDLHDPMPELMMSIYGLSEAHRSVQMLRTLERWSIKFADLALTPNVTFKNLFVSRSCPPDKMQIVMNSPQEEIFPGLDSPDETYQRQEDRGEFRVMHHGSIVHRHGIDLLVQALALVRKKVANVRLDIYGSATPYLQEVMDLAAEIGVADIVRYHGARAQKQIAQAIRECHVGVVPNRRSAFTELNFPTRLFEYLAMRCPVIAPSTTGISDYFGPDELLMFTPNDVEDLAEKICWVRMNPCEAKGIVERGIEVYRRHLWRGEKAHFLEQTGRLIQAAHEG